MIWKFLYIIRFSNVFQKLATTPTFPANQKMQHKFKNFAGYLSVKRAQLQVSLLVSFWNTFTFFFWFVSLFSLLFLFCFTVFYCCRLYSLRLLSCVFCLCPICRELRWLNFVRFPQSISSIYVKFQFLCQFQFFISLACGPFFLIGTVYGTYT